jgi:ferrous iron transport protein B
MNQSNPVIAVMGNPNTGKSTLFNKLTGMRQKTANFPGVTVERHTGLIKLPQGPVTLVDLPGTYSLAAGSPDELVATDVLMGKFADMEKPRALLAVVDATNLRRNLFLVSQAAELGIPLVIALNMSDLAEKQNISIDADELARRFHATVVPFAATAHGGADTLINALSEALDSTVDRDKVLLPEVQEAARPLAEKLRGAGHDIADYEIERALIDADGSTEKRLQAIDNTLHAELLNIRQKLATDAPLATLEARRRYQHIDATVAVVESRSESTPGISNYIDRATNHPVIGTLLFLVVMASVFQAVFSWATPLMDMIDAASGSLGNIIASNLPPGALSSLLVDGVIAGVGSVIIFLPQIIILFAFIIFLEDSGYMSRAAFVMDRLMRSAGLSGQSFIPMLSSFACAVPGIMATRVIPNRRDRIATIIAAPFMTCSARLPVYALLIAAFVPPEQYFFGLLNLQGLVLLGLYLLGIVGGILTALLLKKTALRGPTPSFLIELPPYRMPNMKSVGIRLLDRAKIFLKRAGTVIFTVAVLIWFLAYFPRPAELAADFEQERVAAATTFAGAQLETELTVIDHAQSAAYLEQSFLGTMGKTIQPVFAPLGWDWKISAAVIASFPAREVVVAILGTIYAVGDEVDETDTRLTDRLRNAKWPDGSVVFTTPMAIGLAIFYAFCLQCVATIAIMRRETNGWGWPIFAWVYMTGLGYLGALLAFQLGS